MARRNREKEISEPHKWQLVDDDGRIQINGEKVARLMASHPPSRSTSRYSVCCAVLYFILTVQLRHGRTGVLLASTQQNFRNEIRRSKLKSLNLPVIRSLRLTSVQYYQRAAVAFNCQINKLTSLPIVDAERDRRRSMGKTSSPVRRTQDRSAVALAVLP
jgi:hypothetical protein